jgi:hypothetical protein
MGHQLSFEQIEAKYGSLFPLMDERMRRQWAAAEPRAFGWGGVQAISGALRLSPNTIRKGLAELIPRDSNPNAEIDSRLRKKGGGRKRCSDSDAGLRETLEWLVEPVTRGDPCEQPFSLNAAQLASRSADPPLLPPACTRTRPPFRRLSAISGVRTTGSPMNAPLPISNP